MEKQPSKNYETTERLTKKRGNVKQRLDCEVKVRKIRIRLYTAGITKVVGI